jgi:hypothetical protein
MVHCPLRFQNHCRRVVYQIFMLLCDYIQTQWIHKRLSLVQYLPARSTGVLASSYESYDDHHCLALLSQVRRILSPPSWRPELIPVHCSSTPAVLMLHPTGVRALEVHACHNSQNITRNLLSSEILYVLAARAMLLGLNSQSSCRTMRGLHRLPR